MNISTSNTRMELRMEVRSCVTSALSSRINHCAWTSCHTISCFNV